MTDDRWRSFVLIHSEKLFKNLIFVDEWNERRDPPVEIGVIGLQTDIGEVEMIFGDKK